MLFHFSNKWLTWELLLIIGKEKEDFMNLNMPPRSDFSFFSLIKNTQFKLEKDLDENTWLLCLYVCTTFLC